MKLIIDLILLLILVFCTWQGFRKGLVGSIAGVVAIVVAIYGGSILSVYAEEFMPVLEPFVDGYVDSQKTRDEALEKMGYGDSDLSLEDILAQDPSLRYDYASHSLQAIGFYEKTANVLSERSVSYADENSVNMTDAIVAVLSQTICHVGGLTLGFLLIIILITAILNIGGLSFRFNNAPIVDEAGGAVMGLVEAGLYCVLLCWLLSFFGIILGAETLENTILAKFFLSFGFITDGLL